MKSAKKKTLPTIWHNQNLHMIGAGLMLVILFLAVSSSLFYRYKYVQQQTPSSSYPLATWQPGDIINEDRFIFSFNSARTDTQDIPHAWELESGNKFLMVNLSFKNLQNIDYQLSPITSMRVEGDDGVTYDVSSAPFIKDSLGGPVKPGQTVRGEVGFTVPETLTSGDFVFDPGLIDAHQIRVHFRL